MLYGPYIKCLKSWDIIRLALSLEFQIRTKICLHFWQHDIIDVCHLSSVYSAFCEGMSDLGHWPNKPAATTTIIGEYNTSYYHDGALILYPQGKGNRICSISISRSSSDKTRLNIAWHIIDVLHVSIVYGLVKGCEILTLWMFLCPPLHQS